MLNKTISYVFDSLCDMTFILIFAIWFHGCMISYGIDNKSVMLNITPEEIVELYKISITRNAIQVFKTKEGRIIDIDYGTENRIDKDSVKFTPDEIRNLYMCAMTGCKSYEFDGVKVNIR